MKRCLARLCITLGIIAGWGAAMGQTAAQTGEPAVPPCVAGHAIPPLPANAEQLAGEIGVLPLVRRLRAFTSACANNISVEELSLRQQITAAVVTAALEVDEVAALINFEQAQIMELQDRLLRARDKKVKTLTLASIIIGTGSGSVGTAMQFSTGLVKPGDWVKVVGGVGNVGLSILALRQQGGKGTLGVAPHMLAPILGLEPSERIYPQDVWTYLNTTPVTDPKVHDVWTYLNTALVTDPKVHVPWKDELVAEWVRLGRVGPPTAPESQEKISKMTADHKRLSIDDLTDRNAMLVDLRPVCRS